MKAYEGCGCKGLHIRYKFASHDWDPEFASQSLHVGFVMDETESRFLPFSPTTSFIPPFLHIHHFHFRFISSAPMIVRQAWSAGLLAIHKLSIKGLNRILSLGTGQCLTRVENIYLYILFDLFIEV